MKAGILPTLLTSVSPVPKKVLGTQQALHT